MEVVDSLAESEVEVARMGGGGWTQPEPPHQTLNTTHSTIHLHGHHDDSGHSSGGEGGGMGGPGSVMGVSSVEIGGHGGSSPPVVHDGKHSLLQFALQHFRVSKEQGIVQPDGTLQTKTKKKKANKDSQAGWTWKEQVSGRGFTHTLVMSVFCLVSYLLFWFACWLVYI